MHMAEDRARPADAGLSVLQRLLLYHLFPVRLAGCGSRLAPARLLQWTGARLARRQDRA